MSEARNNRNFGLERVTLTATLGARELVQCPSGRAGYLDRDEAASAGDSVDLKTTGGVILPKAANVKALKGGRAYWDHSANEVTFRKVNDRDFYVGRYAGDADASAGQCEVLLGEDPPYDIDLARDAFLSTLVGTPAAAGFGYPVRLGGAHVLELTATNEAQKVDLLSVDGFSKDANPIIEFAYRVISDGAGAEPDFNIGAANGTHASDADAIGERLFVHQDGNSLNISAQSDDGTVEVAITDTTIDNSEGGAVANRVEGWIDCRDPADAQVYINGALVLGGSVFRIDNSAGPWFLLAHLEKTAAATAYKVAIDRLTVRFAEQ